MSILAEDEAGIEYDYYDLICKHRKDGVTEEVIRKALAAALAVSFDDELSTAAETAKRGPGRPGDPKTFKRLSQMELNLRNGMKNWPAALAAAGEDQSLAKSLDVAHRRKTKDDPSLRDAWWLSGLLGELEKHRVGLAAAARKYAKNSSPVDLLADLADLEGILKERLRRVSKKIDRK